MRQRHRDGTAARVGAGKRTDAWTPAEDDALRMMAGRCVAAEIGKQLSRTRRAVQYRATVLGVALQIDDLSLNLVCHLFGAHFETIRRRWVVAGLLPARRAGTRGRDHSGDYRIREVDLEVFIREYPWAYDAQTMFPPRHRLAQLAARVQRRDPWLRIGELQERLGVSRPTISRWCKSGVIPSKRRWLGSSGTGGIVVRERDLEAAAAEIARRRGTARARSTTALLTANRRWRAEQVPA